MVECAHSQANETYLCISELSSGFAFDKGSRQWKHARFEVKGEKYLLSNKSGRWKWKTFGEDDNQAKDCGSFSSYGYINCQIYFGTVTFSKQNMRFLKSYLAGYTSAGVAGNEDGGDEPHLTIGTCSTL